MARPLARLLPAITTAVLLVPLVITSVQNMSIPPSPERCLALLENAPAPIRVRVIRFLLTDKNGRLAQEGRDLRPIPGSLVTVSGTKWVLDGTPIERTAATPPDSSACAASCAG